jgi:hypothetical protein
VQGLLERLVFDCADKKVVTWCFVATSRSPKSLSVAPVSKAGRSASGFAGGSAGACPGRPL